MSSRGDRDFVVDVLRRLARPGVVVDDEVAAKLFPGDVRVAPPGGEGHYFLVADVIAAYDILGDDADDVVASHLARLGLS